MTVLQVGLLRKLEAGSMFTLGCLLEGITTTEIDWKCLDVSKDGDHINVTVEAWFMGVKLDWYLFTFHEEAKDTDWVEDSLSGESSSNDEEIKDGNTNYLAV